MNARGRPGPERHAGLADGWSAATNGRVRPRRLNGVATCVSRKRVNSLAMRRLPDVNGDVCSRLRLTSLALLLDLGLVGDRQGFECR